MKFWMNSDSMNSKCHIHKWIHSFHEFMYEYGTWNFIESEFMYEYSTMNSMYVHSHIWIQKILWIHISECTYIEFIVLYSYEFTCYEIQWNHELLHLIKLLHVKCLATLIFPMLSSCSGTTNCLKVFTLPFILPIPAVVCKLLICSHSYISGWHQLATSFYWSSQFGASQAI